MDSSKNISYTLETESTHTLSTDQQITQKKPTETGHDNAAGEDPYAAAFSRVGRIEGRRRRTRVMIAKDGCHGGGEELTDEKSEVEKKIVTLQKIVPGGESLPLEELFEETAEYILALKWQVKALRFLADFVQSSEKKRGMLGG